MDASSGTTTHLEQALRDAESLCHTLLELSPAGIAVADAQGQFLRVNRRLCEILGCEYGTLEGMRWPELVYPVGFATDLVQALHALQAPHDSAFLPERSYRRRDGTALWVDLRVARVRDTGGGEPLYLVVAVESLAARREAERLREELRTETALGTALRSIEQGTRDRLAQLRAIYKNAPVGLCYLDRELRFVSVNEHLARMNEAPPEAHLGRTVREMLPTTADVLEPLLQRVLATGEPVLEVELHGVGPRSGSESYALASYVPVKDEAGRTTLGVNIVVQDITQRKQAEVALRESEQRFRLALAGSGVIVSACDRELRYTWLHNPHPAFREVAALGRRDDELAPAAAVAELVRLKQEVLTSGQGVQREVEVAVLGRRTWYDVRAEPLRDETGAIVGVITAAVDLTERRQAEEERERLLHALSLERERLAEANRAKLDFLAAMSHELRTPLNAVVGYAQLLEMGIYGPLTTLQAQALARIDASQQYLLRLINDILSFAKLEAGRVEFHLQPCEVAALLAGLDEMLAPQAQARGVDLQIAAVAPGWQAMADAERAQQVLLNLMGNALKHSPAGGVVHVGADADADWVHLRVRDHGPGIPPEKQALIFDPFVQISSRAAPAEGAGLGLAISRELARGMDARLGVHSEPGAGSTFTLSLPRVAGDEARACPQG